MTFVTQSLFTGFAHIFGSKIQVFFQTQGYQKGEQETLKRQEQSVMNDALQTYR